MADTCGAVWRGLPLSDMAQTTYTVDCTAPINDNFFKLQDLVEYFNKKIKVAGLRNNHQDKISIETEDHKLVIKSNIKTSKRSIRYNMRKFLKKNDIRDRFRVIATSKNAYELRAYRVSTDE